MSANGDSTRDWLLKKLLKASNVLHEQEKELNQLKNELVHSRANSEALASTAQRLAERADDLEFEVQQLRRVPPIAPNLTVMYRDRRGLSEQLHVTSVEHAAGKTLIRTERS